MSSNFWDLNYCSFNNLARQDNSRENGLNLLKTHSNLLQAFSLQLLTPSYLFSDVKLDDLHRFGPVEHAIGE